MTVWPLTCEVQHYEWGSRTSIPARLGQPTPQDEPWAELWMGAHPKAPCHLADGKSLADFIAEDPALRLGPATLAKGHQSLPFLFKILAAEGPLSIQCHPNKAQAEAGFAAENAAGIPIDAPHRNYRDANHKPELIVALEEFWALKGFRAPAEIAELFGRAAVKSARPLLESLGQVGGLRSFFEGLLALDPEQTRTLLSELAAGLGNLPRAEARWTQGLLARYPRDQGATAALVLQLVRLDAGQGLYLGAGELHAYLRGTGLEIMANSDNVLRGGLTPKHVDPEQLMQVLRFEHHPVEVLQPSGEDGLSTYQTPCDEFALSLMRLEAGQECAHQPKVPGAEIWLALGGDAELEWDGGRMSLRAGQVAFVTADTPPLRARNGGTTPCDLWIAGTGP